MYENLRNKKKNKTNSETFIEVKYLNQISLFVLWWSKWMRGFVFVDFSILNNGRGIPFKLYRHILNFTLFFTFRISKSLI